MQTDFHLTRSGIRRLETKKPIKPLPYGIYYATALLCTLVGLATTIYLSFSHYRLYQDLGYKSFCAISRSINCDTVSQSGYAVLLGMPLAVWGALGYLSVLVILAAYMGRSEQPQRGWATIQTLALLFCSYDVYLAWVSSVYIKSYCILCLLTYGVNFSILYLAWLTRRRFSQASFLRCLSLDLTIFLSMPVKSLVLTLAMTAIIGTGMGTYPSYWNYALPKVSSQVGMGYTAEGNPWIGAHSPTLVIEEYSDYLCFQCAKMHAYLRQLVNLHPEKIRLIHHHFPMDKAYNPLVKKNFHAGAGQMALLALYAQNFDKFWQMNDLLFEKGRQHKDVGMRGLSKTLELNHETMVRSFKDTRLLKLLWKDIRSGFKHNIAATPSFVVNGKVYQGTIPPEVWQSFKE